MPNRLKTKGPLLSNITLYADATNGNDTTGRGTQAMPYKTIQRAIDMIPSTLNGFSATVSVAAGTYPEDVKIIRKNGGSVIVKTPSGAVSIRSVTASESGFVDLNNVTLNVLPEGHEEGLFSNASKMFVSGTVTVAGKINVGVLAQFDGVVQVSGTLKVDDCRIAVSANFGNIVLDAASSGTGNGLAYQANRGFLFLTNDGINGTSKWGTSQGGRIYLGAQTNVPNY